MTALHWKNEKGAYTMIKRVLVIKNVSEIQEHMATHFIRLANQFQSQLRISVGERSVNAKSLLGILSMGLAPGTTLTLMASGSDEQVAVDEIKAFLEQ